MKIKKETWIKTELNNHGTIYAHIKENEKWHSIILGFFIEYL